MQPKTNEPKSPDELVEECAALLRALAALGAQ